MECSEGHEGHFQPYVVLGLPTNLWGRDVLETMGVVLTTQALKGENLFINNIMMRNVTAGFNNTKFFLYPLEWLGCGRGGVKLFSFELQPK